MNKILAAIYAHASNTPEKIALTGATTQLTYAQLAAQIDSLSEWFIAQQIGRAGLWGAWRCKLLEGQISYLQEPLAFVRKGEFLPCCSVPVGDIKIEIPS